MRQKILLGLTLVLATGGCEGDDVVFDGPVSESTVAGTASPTTIILSISTADSYAAHTLTWGERQDRPCSMDVTFLDGLDANVVDVAALSVCPGSVQGNQERTVAPGLSARRRAPGLLFVNEVQVSNSVIENSNRLKGIRLWWASIAGVRGDFSDLDCGSLLTGGAGLGSREIPDVPCTDEEVYSNFRNRANADEGWSSKASCPLGMVATSVIVHVTSATDGEITGLQLGCQTARIARR
jgi:hypothetical protein